jgi:hypothetical protein
MSLPDVPALVAQGIAAFNAGDRDRAYALLTEALHADSHNEAGWLWMSGVVQEPAERRYCLERVVEINPQHAAAQRGLAKLPADLVARSPLPAPKAAQADVARCTYPGCTQAVARAGHTLCYAHWKQAKQPKAAQSTPKMATPSAAPTAAPQAAALLTASQLGERLELSSQRINLLLTELGWIEHKGPSWYLTEQGQTLGAVQRHYHETGKAYVVWPEPILEHKALHAAMQSVRGEAGMAPTASRESGFRKRFPAEHRTTDGHLVRSKAELLIDNWLYMAGVVHAYERRLPLEEEVYCDFYVPAGKVYIEYWGLENDSAYNERRKTKTAIYQRHRLQLIELTDEHIRNLDDHMPKLLLKYGISVE